LRAFFMLGIVFLFVYLQPENHSRPQLIWSRNI